MVGIQILRLFGEQDPGFKKPALAGCTHRRHQMMAVGGKTFPCLA